MKRRLSIAELIRQDVLDLHPGCLTASRNRTSSARFPQP